MSSAGHILDMINKIKQNRAYQSSKKSSYISKRNQINQGAKPNHVPDLPREKIKTSVFLKYFNAILILILIGLIALIILQYG